ncbi:uncharacterized protein [Oscarella lobularis]
MVEDRCIVLTGATKGLGLALVEECFSREDTKKVRLFGCGRNSAKVAELNAKYAPRFRFTALSVADPKAVEAWAKQVVDECDGTGPNLLINNASVANERRPLWNIERDEFDAIVDINLKGTFYVIKAFLPAMTSGMIVNMTSGWGRTTDADVAPYCATKFAQEGLSLALADDLRARGRSGIGCCPLNPGVIDTDMLRTVFGPSAANHWKPDEWAKVALSYMLSLTAADSGKRLTVPRH